MAISRRIFLQSLYGLGAQPVAVAQSADAAERDPVGYFSALRGVLADSDNAVGPGRVLAVAKESVVLKRAARLAARGSAAIELAHIETQFIDLVGWLHQDSGDFLAAGYWLDRALELSVLVPGPAATAFVLTRKAQLAIERGDSASALDHSAAAITLVGARHRFAALALTWQGQAFALQGQVAQSADAFANAHDVLHGCSQKPTDSPWAQFFDHSYVQIHRASAQSVLSQYDSAIAGFSAGIDRAQAATIGRETGSARIAAILQKDHLTAKENK